VTAPTRVEVIDHVARHLAETRPGHPLRVAVDGVTAAGKTTFAAELCAAVAASERPALHLSMDGYHHRRAHRHRQGRESAVGYYEDAYDFDSFARLVLRPLGPGGDRRYRPSILDLATDEPVDDDPIQAHPFSVLVVDGTFLQRDQLATLWDVRIFLDTSVAVALTRAMDRDVELFGGTEETRHAYESRYHAACRRYLAEYAPADRADIVIENDDLSRPVLRCGYDRCGHDRCGHDRCGHDRCGHDRQG
jgi:uridine kinase